MLRLVLAVMVLSASSATAQEVPSVIAEMPLNEWTPISNNTLADVDPCPEGTCAWSGRQGQKDVIDAWTGGAFASAEGELGGLVYFGGGHNGYYGNEVYFFDLSTLLWERRNEPTDGQTPGDASTMGLDSNCRFWDGAPVPPHTFDSVVYHPATNRFIMLSPTDVASGLPGRTDGCGSTVPAVFDFDSNRWGSAMTAGPVSLIYAATAWDPNRGLFWGLSPRTPLFVSYDPVADAWAEYPGEPVAIEGVGAIHPQRDLFVSLNFRSTPQVFVRDLSQPDNAMVTVTTTGDAEIEGLGAGSGFEWAPRLDAFVAWSTGTDIYLLTPPGGDFRTEPWIWTRVPNGGADPGEIVNGSFSKFQWVDSLGIAIIATSRTAPVYAVRLMAGFVPPDPPPMDPLADAAPPATPDGSVVPTPDGGMTPAPGAPSADVDGDAGCGCSAGRGRANLAFGLLSIIWLIRRRAR